MKARNFVVASSFKTEIFMACSHYAIQRGTAAWDVEESSADLAAVTANEPEIFPTVALMGFLGTQYHIK